MLIFVKFYPFALCVYVLFILLCFIYFIWPVFKNSDCCEIVPTGSNYLLIVRSMLLRKFACESQFYSRVIPQVVRTIHDNIRVALFKVEL